MSCTEMPLPLLGQRKNSQNHMVDLRRPGAVAVETVNYGVAVQHETNMRAPFGVDPLEGQEHCHRFEDIDVKRLEF